MLQLVIISDTHAGTIEKLDSELISDIKNADAVIHAGDADTSNFISELKRKAKLLYAVRGNCDLDSNLPAQLLLELEGVKVGIAHGSGGHTGAIDRLGYMFSDDTPDIIIFGHSHVPLDETADGIRFINPGSPSLNRSVRYGTYCMMSIDGKKIKNEFRRIG